MDEANISEKNVTFEEQAYAINIEFPNSLSEYRVRCLPVNKTLNGESEMTVTGKGKIKVDSLCDDTNYKLSVLWIDKRQGTEILCFKTEKRTKKSSARILIAKMDCRSKSESLYFLEPVKRTPLKDDIEQKYFKFGTELDAATVKTIYLLGESGSGKTTLVNAIANYLFGVQYADTFRINVTSYEDNKSNTVCYKITPAIEVGYKWSLNIIDVKSFKSGSEDNSTTANKPSIVLPDAQGKSIFCLVLRSTYRFHENDTNMWKSIISAGKQRKNVIFVPLFTFCDAHNAKAMEALDQAKIPYHRDKCFYFSNGKMNKEDKETVDEWEKRNDLLLKLLELEDDRTDENTSFDSIWNEDMKEKTSKATQTYTDELPKQDNLKTNLAAQISSTLKIVVQALAENGDLMKQNVRESQDIKKEVKLIRELLERACEKTK